MESNKQLKNKKSTVRSYRRFIQVVFFILIALIAINHSLTELGIIIPFISTASLHALCPFGGVVSIYQYFATGVYVRKVHESSFILMGLVFILTILFGPVFCGWVCPLGTFQEWISKIGRKLFKKKHNNFIPTKLDRYLRFLRYAVLGWVIYLTTVTGKLIFSDYDPYHSLFTFWTGEAAIAGILILIITIILSLFIERPFCKYACPYGALLGLSNNFRIVKLWRREDSCIDCKKCNRDCPMNIDVASSNSIDNHQCISCYKCTSQNSCPVDKTVEISTKSFSNKSFVFKESFISITIFLVIVGGIGLTMWFNIWQSVSGKEPARYISGDMLGEYNPADIRGSYTFSNTSEYFNIPISVLAEAFYIPESIANNMKQSELEKKYPELAENGTEIGNGSVKLFVALYTQLPYEVTEPVYLLEPAVNILKNLGTLKDDQLKYIEDHKILLSSLSDSTWENFSSDSVSSSEEASEDDKIIKGNTTFKDLLDWGITQEDIENIINTPMPKSILTIKDYCENAGLNFGEIKVELGKLLSNELK